ncbi:hypothetical protein CLCR_09338 [Cladophialophora carrionii]|uniref:Uncharacterized protein n=1 Tax=Cladophialophora carrionii TaxID=86049 RepID=A0A1C1CUX3_9EURO|nr:hypothetical protein CLCR_09338 [Cladophialophora carrionii]
MADQEVHLRLEDEGFVEDNHICLRQLMEDLLPFLVPELDQEPRAQIALLIQRFLEDLCADFSLRGWRWITVKGSICLLNQTPAVMAEHPAGGEQPA